MLKVNLSRIANLIKLAREDLQEFASRLDALDQEPELKIFQATTEADMDRFRQKCADYRRDFFALAYEKAGVARYIAFLRKTLDSANVEYGVSSMLQQMNALQAIRESAQATLSTMQRVDSRTESYVEIKSADFYKSAYTPDNRIYSLGVSIFSPEDIRSQQKEVTELTTRIRQLADELAEINQTRFVEIPSREEFLRDERWKQA